MPITINGSGTVTGISAGGLPDGVITTDDIAANAVTQAKRSEQLTLDTAKASTSGTFIDFTGIPSWVKRITVMFNGVSTNGTSLIQLQLGSGSFATSGYNSSANFAGSSTAGTTFSSTTGLLVDAGSGSAAGLRYGQVVLALIGSNTWTESFVIGNNISAVHYLIGGGGASPALSGTLDRVRITTVNGTDTFDAGSINILYE